MVCLGVTAESETKGILRARGTQSEKQENLSGTISGENPTDA